MSKFENSLAFKRLLHKIKYLSYAFITVGIVFKINHWEGSSVLIIAGGLTLSAIFVITAFSVPEDESTIDN
jgi:hypothetical protein